jgi:hypothetical protein
MWNRIVSSPLVYLFLFAGVILSYAIGFSLSNRILLPLLNVAFSYPVLYRLVADGKRNAAFAPMLFWAFCMGIVGVVAVLHFPERGANSIIYGRTYQAEMFQWIRTGIGTESDPWRFLPQHLLHFAIFAVLSLLTASIVSLLMGAVLMNYMNFYAASVIQASHNNPAAILMAWHVWAIVRVASFVMLGVILGEPGICRLSGRDYDYEGARPYFWLALTGLVVDIALKTLLAPWWSDTLRKLIA